MSMATQTVSIWLDRDPALNRRALDASQAIVREALELWPDATADKIRNECVADVAEHLEKIVKGQARNDTVDYSLGRDLARDALDTVMWDRIAHDWVDGAIDFADREGVEALTR